MGDAFHCHSCGKPQDACICPEPPLSYLKRYAPIGHGSSLMAQRQADGQWVKLADVQALWEEHGGSASSRAREGQPSEPTGLRAYVQHRFDCAKWEKGSQRFVFNDCRVCTCGLDALLTASTPREDKL